MKTMRGKLLKAPDTTPGLLLVHGLQRSFALNGIWQSVKIAPAAGLNVEIEFGDGATILAVRPVFDFTLIWVLSRNAITGIFSVRHKSRLALNGSSGRN